MRLLRSLHAWAGLVLAAFVAVLGVSGALLVFKADYLRATIPAAREPATVDAASLAPVAAAAEQLFPGEVRTLVFATADLGLHQLRLADGGGAYLDRHGRLLDRWSEGGRAEVWLFELHHELLAGEIGHTIGGIAGLAAALMAAVGLILWAPAARSFAGRLWPRSLSRRDLLAHHRDLGALAAAPILVLALTGTAMVFSAQARALLSWVLPGSAAPAATLTTPALPLTGSPRIEWASALLAAQQRFPDATLRIASWPSEPGAPLTIRLRRAAEWHPNGRTRALIDPATGGLLDAQDALREPLADRVYNTLYPLHAARVGGRLYGALAFLSGLALAVLGVLGAYSFAQRLRRRAEDRSGRLAALTARR